MMAASILLKATIIMAFALAGARVARRSPAAARHVLLAAAFVVLLILPITSMVAPSVRVAVPVDVQRAIEPLDSPPVSGPAPSAGPADAVAPELSSAASSTWPSPSALVLGGWMAGTAAFLLPVMLGLWQVRSLRRTSVPWPDGQSLVDLLAADVGVSRRVDLRLHESIAGPMTGGLVRPLILLPIDAPAWLDDDVRCAIVHELEHVRRGDWMSQCLARLVAACYWFHPIVWIAWRQLSLEAERACDDAVLRRSDATAYADQLVVLARRLSTASHRAQLAMAHRRDLATRVVAVLDSRQRRGRAGALWIGMAGTACGLLVLTISPLRLVAATESASLDLVAAQQKFEVASIKPCAVEALPPVQPGGRAAGPGNASTSPGRAHWDCVTLDQLISTTLAGPGERLLNSLARQRPEDPKVVRGGSAWVYSDKFAIDAKAPGHADRETMIGPMLRLLLEDRFHLKTHRATEERSMYALTVAKGGLRIKPTAPGDCREIDRSQPLSSDPPREGEPPYCGNLHMNWNGGNRMLTSTGTTLQSFTDGLLSGLVMDRFVINRTGLDGRFNIPLEFAPDDNTPGSAAGVAWSRRDGATPPTGPAIFKALEELGLKLEPAKAPAEYLVIDHAEKPTPDVPSAVVAGGTR